MQPPAKIILSAAVVLAAAVICFQQQSSHLSSLRNAAAQPRTTPAAATAGNSRPWTPPPRSDRPAPQGRLIAKLEENLRRLFTEEQREALLEPADEVFAVRLIHATGLSASEQQEVRRQLAALRKEKARLLHAGAGAPASLDARRDAALATLLGPERAALWEKAQAARRRASEEQSAAAAVNRVSRAVSLTASQKDDLHARLLAKAAAPAAAPDLAPRLAITANISTGDKLSIPPLTEEARTILTPEQFAAWEQYTAVTEQGFKQTMSQMMAMLPAVVTSLQELLAEL